MMRDKRLDKWAELLVHYSLNAKAGQQAILTGDPVAMPLLEACYEAFIKAGVHVEPMLIPTAWSETLYTHASDKLLSHTPKFRLNAMENCDIYLYVDATTNSKAQANVDPKKQSLAAKAKLPLTNAILDRAAKGECRWALTHFPTPSAAQDAEMSTSDYIDFVMQAGEFHHDDPVSIWKDRERTQQKMVDYLNEKSTLHFTNSQGTDLEVDIDGMKWVNCCGKINFPDGEVYTGPNLKAKDGGVNGVAKYSFPTHYRGVEVHDIELTFEHGAVVNAKASKGEAFLKEMIKQDDGARFVGEIAIGTNYGIKQITKHILFDEKFGGTFHLALGKGYPQTGNTNVSALHWDMIFDLRNGGKITADGETISENGLFLNPEWTKLHSSSSSPAALHH